VKAGPVTGADHHLGRAAADVDHQRRREIGGVALAGGAEKGQLRLLIAGEHVRLDPVALPYRVGELLTVGGVAHGAGQHRDRGLRAVLVDLAAVAVERGVDTLHGVIAQAPLDVDPRSEPGDVAVAHELGGDPAVDHIGDQQPGRVGPDVHHGHAHRARIVADRPPRGSEPTAPDSGAPEPAAS
jgi:hypothetical protein